MGTTYPLHLCIAMPVFLAFPQFVSRDLIYMLEVDQGAGPLIAEKKNNFKGQKCLPPQSCQQKKNERTFIQVLPLDSRA